MSSETVTAPPVNPEASRNTYKGLPEASEATTSTGLSLGNSVILSSFGDSLSIPSHSGYGVLRSLFHKLITSGGTPARRGCDSIGFDIPRSIRTRCSCHCSAWPVLFREIAVNIQTVEAILRRTARAAGRAPAPCPCPEDVKMPETVDIRSKHSGPYRRRFKRSRRPVGVPRPPAMAILSLAIALLCTPILTLSGCGEKDDRPNVLVIIIDTLRADYLGCYGADTGATPNMDRLAAGGAMFSQCVTSVPVTLPSISTILTSTYPPYHGVRDNGVFTLDQSLITLPEVFHDAGYATGAVVGAYVVSEGTGIEQGFDYFDSEFSGDYARESSLEPGRARKTAKTQRRADEVTLRAAEWMKSSRRPFFMLVHYFDPHSPYDPPPAFGRRFSQSVYLGEVAFCDSEFGRLMDAAEDVSGQSGLITALVADHGEGLGEHGEEQHGYFIYDSTLLVPFIVSYDGVIPPGLDIDRQTSTVDLAPTALDLAGLAIPHLWQGTSLAGEISPRGRSPSNADSRGNASGDGQERPSYLETYRTRFSYSWSELVGIRYNGWKFIRAPKPELYNLSTDPRELENLYALEPDQVALMESALDELSAAVEGPFVNRGPTEDIDEVAVQKLKALGYVMPGKTRPSGPLPDPKDMVNKLNLRFEAARCAEEARGLIARGDIEGAEEKLLAALELDPKSAVSHHDLGLIYWERGDREEGLRLLEEAVSLDGSSAAPHLNLGIAYMSLGRHRDAIEEFKTGVSLNPDDLAARYKYAKALETAGNLQAALDQYYECLTRNPGMRIAQYDAAVILARTGRPAEARRMLEALIADNPADRVAQSARALLGDLR